MTHAEALTIAREHVEKMATNARGYQDGATLAGKVAAVETFARFLMEQAGPEDTAGLAATVDRLADRVEDLEDARTAISERLHDLEAL